MTKIVRRSLISICLKSAINKVSITLDTVTDKIYLGNMFLKGMKLHMAPCIEVVTLNDLCNIDENTYTPGKKMAREMKSLVSIHNA